MNEILQKRIEKAAEKSAVEEIPPYIAGDFVNDSEVECAYKRAQETFVAGATFALQNQWISVEEALLEFKGNFSEPYLVMAEGGWCRVTRYYKTSEKEYWWDLEKAKITHWMPIPQLKGGEE